MTPQSPPDPTRRAFLRRLGLMLPASAAVAAIGSRALNLLPVQPEAVAQALQLTPSCGDTVTQRQTEGPYFKPSSPERQSLLDASMAGTRLVVAGNVQSPGCEPIASALVDFWQADDAGAYDNAGYRMRGHQFTDESGRYWLETVVPGLYPGRTRHIHVKVQAPNGPVLTTQLYFPDEARNRSDGIFSQALLMAIRDVDGGKEGTFNFIIATG